MFFEKVDQQNKVTFDGITYEIQNNSKIDMGNCKDSIFSIYNKVYEEADSRDHNNYLTWKKELVKLLKEWDKLYVNHAKKVWPEMSAIHAKAMLPLTNLITANLNFKRLEDMIKAKEEVPEFRYKALEHEFCRFFTDICELLKTYGNLKNHFNIV